MIPQPIFPGRPFFLTVLMILLVGSGLSSCGEEEPEEVFATAVTLSQTNADMLIGETVQLQVNIMPTAAKDKKVMWASSKNSVATVSGTGLVIALGEGETTITATVDRVSATCRVVVQKAEVPVESVALDCESKELKKGERVTLKATVLPADATEKTVKWSSSDASVATVDQTGTVTANAGGTATITAAVGHKSATCVITVVVPATSIALDHDALVLRKGESATLKATVSPSDATEKDVVFSSSDSTVVTIDQEGVLKAKEGGTATITAVVGSVSATCAVTVVVPASSVMLDPDTLTLIKGESATLQATVSPADATEIEIVWSSSDSLVVSVDSKGKLKANAGGSATITAAVGDVAATCRVTVIVPVSSVSLDQGTLELIKGKTAQLKATVAPVDATDSVVTWSSSDNSVVTVDQEGTLTAKAGGTATVTATAGSKSASCQVSVIVPVESVKLSAGSLTMKAGETYTLSAVVLPEDATDKTLLWNSSNSAVVKVENGMLTAVSPGEATVTVRSGVAEDNCSVKVEVVFAGLTLEAIQTGTITIDNSPLSRTIEYSKDGINWVSETAEYIFINLNRGECVYLRGDNESYYEDGCFTNIQGSSPFYAYGDVMSLIDSKHFEADITLKKKGALKLLFYNSANLYSHPDKKLVLSARVLSDNCYEAMFNGCTHLVSAPELSATQLAGNCYAYMFYGCTSLQNAPVLPADKLEYGCYVEMFAKCASLVSAPALPAMALADSCYLGMFSQCSSLESAPILPATSLSSYCYCAMFRECTSLVSTPALPATQLAKRCYFNMFNGCTSLQNTPALPADKMEDGCYVQMFFDCTSLTRFSFGSLPATKLAEMCYRGMFYGCSSLTSAPALPAVALADSCYYLMFYNCSSLKTAPKLPATSLSTGCYYEMFHSCSSLTSAPALPATSLAEMCYAGMFRGCSSLQSAPALPATSLKTNCYASMFRNCTSLREAPWLPATMLADYCYYHMFDGCSQLQHIGAMFTTAPSDRYTEKWVAGVASSGSFVKNRNASWSAYGENAIPSGWSVSTYNP